MEILEILECRKLWNSENDRNVNRTEKNRGRPFFDLTKRYLIDRIIKKRLWLMYVFVTFKHCLSTVAIYRS